MGFNLKEIAKAWIISFSPSKEQKELAEQRYNICLNCSNYRESRPITHDEYCSDCGCPISKKIFSETYDACPIHNWVEVEINFKDILNKDKNNPKKQESKIKNPKTNKTIF
jgi:hypothetical protein